MDITNRGMNTETVYIRQLDPRCDLDEILITWEILLKDNEHSFFQSMTWIRTWLDNESIKSTVKLIIVYEDSEPVLAFFIGFSSENRNYIINSKKIYINITGKKYYDIIYSEYNTILLGVDKKCSIYKVVKNLSSILKWDEIYFPRMSYISKNKTLNSDDINGELNYFFEEKELISYLVDLNKIRDNKNNYLGLLSSNRRSQIRRSIKHIEKKGKIQIEEAKNKSEALSMFNSLSDLHKKSWLSKEELDAFSNTYFNEFHKKLIDNGFDKGQIQLLKIYNEFSVIGYIYNFVYENNVLFYQCGYSYENDNKSRPGLVSHYYAIMFNLNLGYKTYDFLEGDAGYKKSLATDKNQMFDLLVQKRKTVFRFEKLVKDTINKYNIRFKKTL